VKIHESGINKLVIKNNLIYSCGEDNSICVTDIHNLKLIHKFNKYHSSSIKSLRLHNEYLLTGSYDQKLNLFKTTDNTLIHLKSIKACVSEINDLDFTDQLVIIAVGQGIEIFKINQ
jgi:WD40 repeat protein